jgi:excisionase family DNA binding protein
VIPLEEAIRQMVADELRRVLGEEPRHWPALPAETMTADQVADFLGLDRKTVYDYANAGRIPCRKLGKRLLFSRTQVVAWLRGESALSSEGA